MKLIKSVSIMNPSGKEVKVDVEQWTRGGTKSPTIYVVLSGNRRITPFEQRLRGWRWTLNGLFKAVYSDALESLIPTQNPLLRLLSRDGGKGSLFHQPVLLTSKHGVKFEKR